MFPLSRCANLELFFLNDELEIASPFRKRKKKQKKIYVLFLRRKKKKLCIMV